MPRRPSQDRTEDRGRLRRLLQARGECCIGEISEVLKWDQTLARSIVQNMMSGSTPQVRRTGRTTEWVGANGLLHAVPTFELVEPVGVLAPLLEWAGCLRLPPALADLMPTRENTVRGHRTLEVF